jgi:hypothetical protein
LWQLVQVVAAPFQTAEPVAPVPFPWQARLEQFGEDA